MGLFDRFTDKKPGPPSEGPAAGSGKPVAPGGILPRLAAAREKLSAKDLPGAMAIYEEVLAEAADRADILVTLSADLGTNGHVQELIELLAPRYDAERHGAAAGVNLLQAYIVTRNAEAAQHLLDLLFSLKRPELEARLIGFSNAVAELYVSEAEAEHRVSGPAEKIELVSLSKPIWFYHLEELASHLLPRPEGRLRRVAFAQCALPGVEQAAERAARPEDELGRLSRGLALWLADTFTYSAGYQPVAAVGVMARHHVIFPSEWTAENIRQLNESSDSGLDFVVTGTLRNRNDDFELTLRIWEVKKFRELKAFSTRWNPSTANPALTELHSQLCTYMEWTAWPTGQGLAYVAPAAPLAYALGLGTALTFFLGDKGLLAPEQLPRDLTPLLQAAQANPEDVRAQLALVAALLRQKARGQEADAAAYRYAGAWLASPAAQAADVSALAVKLA